ncbi:MAG: DUF6168 family protein [Bacteroidia bacterium]
MTKSNHSIHINFYATLLILLFASFFIQTWGFNFPIQENKIVDAYVINALLAFAIYYISQKLRKIREDLLGFVFMGGSVIKILLFFIIFYASYKEDGMVSAKEFLSLFIPYCICLLIEAIFLIKDLNR